MKFSYTKNRIYRNLLFGVLWIIIASIYLVTDVQIKWTGYATLLLGFLYISMFFYEYLNKYIEVTPDKISVNSIPKTEIMISDIIEVKYYADDYTFKTNSKSLKVLKSQIDKSQLPEFELLFNNIKQEISKNVV